MYEWTTWLDHVTDPSNVFLLEDLGNGQARLTPAGTVMQQGTPQDQTHFNNIESGIVDAHAAVALLLNYARQNAWEIETGTVTLTNTETFPFNNSKRTVALSHARESTSYVVITELQSFIGNVGEFEITEKLTNGFKLAFNGSGSSATVKYTVIGGFMK